MDWKDNTKPQPPSRAERWQMASKEYEGVLRHQELWPTAPPNWYHAINVMLSAMEMQEQRESGDMHIPGETMNCIWQDAKSAGRAALDELKTSVAHPAPKDSQQDVCDVCAGAGVAISGKPCICGGSGNGYDEKVGLRLECDRLERELATLLATPEVRHAPSSEINNGGWISVEDGLPTCTNGMFLVMHLFQGKHHCQKVCAWFGDKFVDLELHPQQVTHWQPLPKPPQFPEPRNEES